LNLGRNWRVNREEEFLAEWFGVDGREIGTPQRRFASDPADLLFAVQHCAALKKPVYISVQPYKAPDTPCALEKLAFDFDCKEHPEAAWKDASAFADALKRFYRVEPLIVFSGSKGFHVYAFLNKIVYFDDAALAKAALESLQLRLLKGLRLPTLDRSVVGDLKRLMRVPFSLHQQTGKLCQPVTLQNEPFVPGSLDVYRTLDAELLAPVIKQLKRREKLASIKRPAPKHVKGIRPCIQAALQRPLNGGSGHLMRLAVVREYLAAGRSVDEIVSLFHSQADYSEEKTRYYVQQAARNPSKPFKCETIRRLGFCLPNCRRRERNAQ
jgi:hypothetical protein